MNGEAPHPPVSRPAPRRAGMLICIVEGDGERKAVPILVSRLLRHLRRDRALAVDPEFVINARGGDRLVADHDEGEQRGIEFFARRAAREKPAAILVVLDAEERCLSWAGQGPEALGPVLLRRARAVVGGIPTAVVLANRMLETWFLSDFHALRGRGAFPAESHFDRWQTPEALGGCKGRLEELWGCRYLERVHEPWFAERVSLPLKPAIRQRSPSYYKFYRAVDRLSREARAYAASSMHCQ